MANFDYLKEIPQFKNFASICIEAEKRWRTDTPVSCLKEVRTALEVAVRWVYRNDKGLFFENITQCNLYDLTSNKKFLVIIGKNLAYQIHYIRKNGNVAIHESENKIKENIANTCMEYLFNFIQWIEATYCKEHYKKRSFEESSFLDTLSDNFTLKNVGIAFGGAVLTVAGAIAGAMLLNTKDKN